MLALANSIEQRKSEHIQIALNEKVTGESISTGLESLAFIHNALPEIAFDEISIETTFLGFECKTPFLISSMTGGTALAGTINRNLAVAAEERGWALALGSTRALLDSDGHASSFLMRKYAPSVPIIANLGAVQFNYGYGVEECRKIIEITEADMLVLHLNSIQEVIQEKGDTNFKGLLKKIEQLCSTLEVPVGVKEVGWGIDGQTAKKLSEAGVAFIDVAGAGGTSWSQVEKFRAKDPNPACCRRSIQRMGNSDGGINQVGPRKNWEPSADCQWWDADRAGWCQDHCVGCRPGRIRAIHPKRSNPEPGRCP